MLLGGRSGGERGGLARRGGGQGRGQIPQRLGHPHLQQGGPPQQGVLRR